MISLFIDTASSKRQVAIVQDGILLYNLVEDNGTDLSIKMLPLIKEALFNVKLNINDIDKIFVVNGPGSFTGIRVGIAIAKTIAWALKKEIVSISELELMSSSYDEDGYIIPLIDARRGYVYAGIYDSSLNSIIPDQHMSIQSILDISKNYDNIHFVSYDDFKEINNIYIPSIDVVRIIEKHISDASLNPHSVNPIYLKNTEAEDKLNGNI